MEPYQQLEEEYENDDNLDASQNKAFRMMHRKYKFLLTLYYNLSREIADLREENEQLRVVDQERMNKIENRLDKMDVHVENMMKILGKIDDNSTFTKRAIFTGLISLLGGLAVGLIMFAVNN